MARPEIVAEAVTSMQNAVSIPVTVKHRIGIDDIDQYSDMKRFVQIVSDAGAKRFTVHARKAWLNGLNPKENRTIPPLRYPEVYQLKQEFPHLTIEINGGITTLEGTEEHLNHVDAVMIGRAAYDNPFLFSDVDSRFYGVESPQTMSRIEAIERMLPYIDEARSSGTSIHKISRHLLNAFAGQYNGKAWRRFLTENSSRKDAGPELIEEALQLIRPQIPTNN